MLEWDDAFMAGKLDSDENGSNDKSHHISAVMKTRRRQVFAASRVRCSKQSYLTSVPQESSLVKKLIIPLIDGTYELFRHFYGLRRFTKLKDRRAKKPEA